MRFVLLTALFALALNAWASLPAAAGASDHIRDKDKRDRAAAWSDEGPRFRRQRVARATTSDVDEDYEARPRRSTQSEDGDRPRYTKRRHTRKAKHARRHQRVVRRAARKVAHRDGRRQRRADTPAWTRRSLGYTGPAGSGQHGVASFYWQPQRVAAGGWFNPNAMTAAHRTLPFGTRVRVTHATSGRSVEVRINDRGPYIAGRIIDLSKAAAGVIGMTGQGLARVRVSILGR
jgi:rare lipoprotein A